MRRASGVLLVAGALLTACSSGLQEVDAAPTGAVDTISRSEIEAAAVRTVFEVVYKLRPEWLRTRARSASQGVDPIRVYLDNAYQGPAATLRDMIVDDIREIRHLTASDATTRYGTGHTSGAILVFTW